MSSEVLYAGSADGVYRVEGLGDPDGTTAERGLEADQVYRLGRFDGVEGLVAAGESGLYHSPDGTGWTALSTAGRVRGLYLPLTWDGR